MKLRSQQGGASWCAVWPALLLIAAALCLRPLAGAWHAATHDHPVEADVAHDHDGHSRAAGETHPDPDDHHGDRSGDSRECDLCRDLMLAKVAGGPIRPAIIHVASVRPAAAAVPPARPREVRPPTSIGPRGPP